jgi:hypothetical protein
VATSSNKFLARSIVQLGRARRLTVRDRLRTPACPRSADKWLSGGPKHAEFLIAWPQRHVESRLGYIDTYKHWLSYHLIAPTPQPILARCGLLVPGDCAGLCVSSERGDPIATHGFENLGQGRSTTPGLTQIVTTLKIQGQGRSQSLRNTLTV